MGSRTEQKRYRFNRRTRWRILDFGDLQRLDRGQLVKLTGYRTVATIGKRVKLVEARRTPKDERLISEVDEREAIVDQVVNRDDGKQDIWLRKLEA